MDVVANGVGGVLSKSESHPDRAFFRDAVEQLTDRLYSTALRLTRNHADAEDLVADSLALAWTNLSQLDDRQAFAKWVFRILVNTYMSSRRRMRNEARVIVEEASGQPFSIFDKLHQPFLLWWSNPEQELINKLLREDIERALNKLPIEYRAVIVLVEIEGNSYADVAAILDVPIGTVRSRLSRGRSLLQKQLWRQAKAAGILGDTEPEHNT